MAETLKLQVVGEETIHCAGCEQRIDRALRRLEGIEHVDASAETQTVAVTFDPTRVDAQDVRERLVEIGYQVSDAT